MIKKKKPEKKKHFHKRITSRMQRRESRNMESSVVDGGTVDSGIKPKKMQQKGRRARKSSLGVDVGARACVIGPVFENALEENVVFRRMSVGLEATKEKRT